jgi:hypothetical protein
MEFTETQMDLLTAAWATSRDGNGLVITNDAYPDAHRLAEAGWLERRFTQDGEVGVVLDRGGRKGVRLPAN